VAGMLPGGRRRNRGGPPLAAVSARRISVPGIRGVATDIDGPDVSAEAVRISVPGIRGVATGAPVAGWCGRGPVIL